MVSYKEVAAVAVPGQRRVRWLAPVHTFGSDEHRSSTSLLVTSYRETSFVKSSGTEKSDMYKMEREGMM